MSIDPTLSTFIVEVNGDDPRWSQIDPGGYCTCDPDLRVEHLPVQPGRWRVSCRLLEVRDDSVYEVLNAIDTRRFDHPSRAEVETLLDLFKSTDIKVMGICNQQRILKWQQAHHPVFQLIDGQRSAVLMTYHEYCYWADYCIAVTNREEVP